MPDPTTRGDLPAASTCAAASPSCPAATAASARRSPGAWRWPARGWRSPAASAGKAEALAARLRSAGHDAIGVAMDAHADRVDPHRGRRRRRPLRRPRPAGQLHRHPARGAPGRRQRGRVRRGGAGQPQGGDVPRPGRRPAPGRRGRGRPRARPPGAPALGAGAARHARPRLLGLLRDQGRAGDADQAARGRARRRTASPSTASRRRWCAARWARTGWPTRRRASSILARIPLGRVAEPEDVVGADALLLQPGGVVRHRPDALRRRRPHRHPVARRVVRTTFVNPRLRAPTVSDMFDARHIP